MYTKCVNQKIVLDLVDISTAGGWFYGGRASSHGTIQEVHLLTAQANIAKFFQYVMSSGSGFSKMEADVGEGDVTGLLRRSLVVVVSVLHMP